MTTILLIYMVEFTVKCPFIVCTQTAHGSMSRGKNVLRKPVLNGPLESDIVTVRDMSEIATENKVYCCCFVGRPRIYHRLLKYTVKFEKISFKTFQKVNCK